MQSDSRDHRARVQVESVRGHYSLYVRASGHYEARYVGSDRKPHFVTLKARWERGKKTTGSLRDQWAAGKKNIESARSEAMLLAHAKEQGKDVKPDPNLKFDQVAEWFFESFEALVLSGERKQRSLDDYRWRYERYVKQALGQITVKAFDREHVIELLNDLRRKGLSTSTLHVVHRVIACIVEEGRERRKMNVDVRLGKRRIRVENAREIYKPNQEETTAIVGAASARWKLLFVTAATTGARASELLGLSWLDLNLAKGEGSIRIDKQLSRQGTLVPPKTRNGYRTIRIGEGLREALLAEYNRVADKDGFVFAADTEIVGRYGLARRAFTKAVTNAGIDFDREKQKVSMHCFRHAAARRLLREGKTVDQVAAILGDTTATVVNTYLRDEQRDRAIAVEETVVDMAA